MAAVDAAQNQQPFSANKWVGGSRPTAGGGSSAGRAAAGYTTGPPVGFLGSAAAALGRDPGFLGTGTFIRHVSSNTVLQRGLRDDQLLGGI